MVEQHKHKFEVRKATFEAPYHFVDSGLPNVYLVGVRYAICTECGKRSAEIPGLKPLMIKIGQCVIQKEAPLTGAEIRFLRKRLGKKAADFAKIIGVTPEQVSRWETGDNPPSESADKLIRVFYCLLSGDRWLKDKVIAHIDAWLATLPGEEHTTKYCAKLRSNQWTTEPCPA